MKKIKIILCSIFTLLVSTIIVHGIKGLPSKEFTAINIQDENGRTALHRAVIESKPELVKVLLGCSDINVNIQDENECTPLNLALRKVRKKIVEYFCNLALEKIDLTIEDAFGLTSFHWALASRNSEIIKRIFFTDGQVTLNPQIKKIVNSKNFLGYTLLHGATFYGESQVVKTLLGCPGIDINVRGKDGKTANDIAIEKGVEILFK
jgi:ankyrin repeat protein